MKKRIYRIRRYFMNGVSYLIGTSRSLGPPLHIHIETTNICNFKCVYCPQSKPEEHFKILGKGKMPLADFKTIVGKITQAYNVERLVLTRDGEPLVHPQLESFISYAAMKGLKITIGSNGSLITTERAKKLIESGLNEIKGDFCADKIYYEKIRAGAEYEKTFQGYLNILEAAANARAPFRLILVDLNTYRLQTESDILESMNRLKALFSEYESIVFINPAKMHNALGESKTIFSSSSKLKSRRYNRCHHPWLEMVIDYKGNVVGCCRDLRSEYQAGNILEAGNIDKEIWNGKAMRNLRKNLRAKKPQNINICSKCDLPYGESYAGKTMIGKIRRFLQ